MDRTDNSSWLHCTEDHPEEGTKVEKGWHPGILKPYDYLSVYTTHTNGILSWTWMSPCQWISIMWPESNQSCVYAQHHKSSIGTQILGDSLWLVAGITPTHNPTKTLKENGPVLLEYWPHKSSHWNTMAWNPTTPRLPATLGIKTFIQGLTIMEEGPQVDGKMSSLKQNKVLQ